MKLVRERPSRRADRNIHLAEDRAWRTPFLVTKALLAQGTPNKRSAKLGETFTAQGEVFRQKPPSL
jgi:hypothetical protein